MTETRSFRFVVEEVFRLPSRTSVFVLGTLQHGTVRIGDRIELRTTNGATFLGVIEQIEMHTLPGKQTFGIGGTAAEHLAVGAAIGPAPELD